jgi:hypothetical protein
MDNNHIEIMKEDTAKWEYKSRRRNTNPPQTPSRVAHTHGIKLSCELDSTLASIQSARNNAGIDTDSLLVIELSGQANAKQPDIDTLQSKMNLSIVEEVKLDDGKTKLVVQFDNMNEIIAFKHEQSLYTSCSLDGTNRLTAHQRNEMFSCIDIIRPVSPNDRTGKRLLDAIEADDLPEGFFIVDIDI